MKPLIGLTCYIVEAAEFGKNRIRGAYDQDMMMASHDYTKSIENAGGIPLVLPYTLEDSVIKEYVNRMDGILFTGGEDVSPSYYGQAIKRGFGGCSSNRDAFEWKLLTEAMAQGKPIMGICRGMQLINIFYGGTLFQDLNQMAFTSLEHSCIKLPKHVATHEVEVYVNTHLYEMVQNGRLQVNSKHHQSVDRLGDGLIVSSKALDGVIEGIEDPNRPFVVALQWHPEMMAGHDRSQANIFDGFIKHCKK